MKKYSQKYFSSVATKYVTGWVPSSCKCLYIGRLLQLCEPKENEKSFVEMARAAISLQDHESADSTGGKRKKATYS